MGDSKRVAIIGAGMAGLAAAYDLNKAGHRVVIYEAAPGVGGLAAGFQAPHWDWTLEKFYHHWFASDKHMLGLIDELGWSDQVLFPRPYTVIYFEGKFYPFDSITSNMPKFLLRHFSLIDVARFGLAGVYLRFSSNWKPLEGHTAADWTRRYFGQRIYELFWRPMLVGKFGEDNANTVNMAWFWARLHARTTRLGTFAGGFQAFLDKLADLLRSRGVEIRLGTAVTGIRRVDGSGLKARGDTESSAADLGLKSQSDTESLLQQTGRDGQLMVETASGGEIYDAVISTSSPALMAQLAPDLPESYAASLQALKSMGAVVLVITLDRQLTQYYWHNLPKEAGFPFLALVEHTNFMDPEALRRRPHPLLRRLPGTGSRVLQAQQGRAAGALPAGAQAFQPRVRPQLGEGDLALEDRVCAAGAAGQPLAEHPAPAHAPGRPLLRQHEPGLPVGPRHELRRGDRAAGGWDGDGRCATSWLDMA